MRVLLAGGGSAGHTSPLLATADALRRFDPATEIVCLGTARGLETRVVPAAGYSVELIPPVPLPRRLGADLVRVPDRLAGAVRATAEVLRRVRPDVVVGFGGYVALPAYLAARARRLPIVVHEANARPGLANRVAARTCTRFVATSFPDTRLPHAVRTGLPLRRAITTLDRAAARPTAREQFGLDPDRPTLLVTGGSQGALALNSTVAAVAPDLAGAGVQVLHVTGPAHTVTVATPRGADPPYVTVPFVDDMAAAYAAADLTVCRAGANSVAEAAVVGLPAVFVPLPIGNGEQRLNARAVVDAGGALLVENRDFTPAWARAELPDLLTDRARLAAMGTAARDVVPRDADEALARLVRRAAA